MLGTCPLLPRQLQKSESALFQMMTPQLRNNMTSAVSKSVELSVSPISCLHDEPISIRVGGLSPNQEVTLQASMKDVRGVHFMSYAHYRANSDGQIDVEEMESLGGHYEGVFPMGLIGSLLPAPGEYKYTRFFKRDVEHPNIVELSIHNGFLDGEALCSPEKEESLAAVVHERHYMAPGVQRIPVRYKSVRGALFLPPGDGPFPGVIDMFGTAGGLLEYRSAQLASRGIASLALAFFNYDDLPKGLEEFNISYFEEAVEFLLKHEKILGSGVGVIGVSKGGDLALSVAAFVPSVRACVSINSFCGPLGTGIRVKDTVYDAFGWTPAKVKLSDDGVLSMTHVKYDRRIVDRIILPLEQSHAAFLFLVGCDDKNTYSEFQAQSACKYLSKCHYKNDYKVVSYPGAGHLLEPPYSPHCSVSFQQTFMLPMNWGGSTKFHIKGQERAWEEMQNFLWHHLTSEVQIEKNYGQLNYFFQSQL